MNTGTHGDSSCRTAIADSLLVCALLVLAFALYDHRLARQLARLERRLNHRIVDYTSARLAGGSSVQTPD